MTDGLMNISLHRMGYGRQAGVLEISPASPAK
jgi:hypothetical protein